MILKKLVVPKGPYCYRIKRISSRGRIRVRICPFYEWCGEGAFCALLNTEDLLLDDMCKVCGINNDK